MAILKQKKETKKKTAEAEVKEPKIKKGVSFARTSVIKKPWISEKAQMRYEGHQYTFLVDLGANKRTVKEDVERKYGVNVIGVNITSIPMKTKTYRGIKGGKSKLKKATVKVKEGQKIEII